MQEQRKETEFSDIDLKQWKQYDDVLVETLWLLGPRDKTEPHAGDYWGNFIPQIPYQVLTRFTKRDHVVVDFFSGMGTTLIECRRLGRHGIGVEIDPTIARRSTERIRSAPNPYDVYTEVLVGDSTAQETVDRVKTQLAGLGAPQADCVILHPPYHDIITFSEINGDLSRAGSTEAFLEQFGRVAEHASTVLKPSGFMALVIGDKYANAQLVPLGFYCMQRCIDVGFTLKAINVKEIQNNERGKGRNGNLWKYRALVGGFYLFKHEYIMVFRKPAHK
ncbi:MAG: DNA methylase [Euryarchaeota archaeon]|nr:DNA methylase [Euryarchaeota archaeon]